MDLMQNSTSTTKVDWYRNKVTDLHDGGVTSRKKNKIIVEKRRRERINNCLEIMKSLVLQSMQKDAAEYSKMEKADILEMTVKYLQEVQKYQFKKNESCYEGKYQAGFSECAAEVSRYLSTAAYLNPDTKHRLMSHLAGCATSCTTSRIPRGAGQTDDILQCGSLAQNVTDGSVRNVNKIHHYSSNKVIPYSSLMIPVIPINFPAATQTTQLPGSPPATTKSTLSDFSDTSPTPRLVHPPSTISPNNYYACTQHLDNYSEYSSPKRPMTVSPCNSPVTNLSSSSNQQVDRVLQQSFSPRIPAEIKNIPTNQKHEYNGSQNCMWRPW